ncbi:MAG: tRNA lysidine(34) synthetase TilS [Candidatus Fischerbacteria bacterium RBG_13_37_8]|uniref:tRNA(Ile)-lysidine synthase n=1 Tax=Candidatus Fischerbacteria bacterium RBG_13_37_8 TaxID=1817863 RepID=A0A1F5V5M8_9BACT|nr:MAG: tRNA lysidine(34) synthetase TilS [Candidatus Fischerbacteria bacterium RBG_13_37_8]
MHIVYFFLNNVNINPNSAIFLPIPYFRKVRYNHTAMNMNANEVRNIFLNNLCSVCEVKPGEKILIACSGGADSIAMLHLFYKIRDEMKLDLMVCHINYGLRGMDSERDERIVLSACKEFGIACQVRKMSVEKKYQSSNLEETLREFRYAVFYEEASQNGCKKIAVAHNKNDQAETFLLNLLRGAGTEGLSAMTYRSDNRIIRPLLNISRDEIMEYLEENKLLYGEDETNYSMTFTRNKVRNMLIPYLQKEFNPSVVEVLFSTSFIFKDEGTILNEICQKYMNLWAKKEASRISFPLEIMTCFPVGIQRRIIRLLYKHVAHSTRRLHFRHIEAILKKLNTIHKENVLHLPNLIRVRMRNDAVVFYSKGFYDKIEKFEYRMRVPVRFFIEEVAEEIELSIISPVEIKEMKNCTSVLYVDFSKCAQELTIRNRRNGDEFKPLGAPGRKKLKDYFINKKIARSERDKLIIIESRGTIVGILGAGIHDDYKVTEATNKVLCMRLIND